jgi:hypothetical protein
MIIIDPASAPADPANWTAGIVGGTPGTAEATPYEQWLALYPALADPADRLPDADPDGDGVDNRSEYAFGLDPADGRSRSPYTAMLDPKSATFGYTRRNPSLTGLTYRIWTSSDLNHWTEDPGAIQTTTDTGANQSVTVMLGDPPAPAAARFFVRVSAE